MRTRLLGALGAIGCAVILMAPGAAVADTLDQQQPNTDAGAAVYTMESLAQTFTAGLTGGLDRVDLVLSADNSSPDHAMTIEIRDVAGGSPGTAVLATGSVVPSAVNSTDAWVPVTFATAASVTAGTHYAIVAYSPVDNSHRYLWNVAFTDPYPAGANFFQIPPGPDWTVTTFDADQAFKTYVEVPPAAGPTGQRAAAQKRCKKKFKKKSTKSNKKRKKCLKKARKLPV